MSLSLIAVLCFCLCLPCVLKGVLRFIVLIWDLQGERVVIDGVLIEMVVSDLMHERSV